jgi:chromosome segregation ATPase
MTTTHLNTLSSSSQHAMDAATARHAAEVDALRRDVACALAARDALARELSNRTSVSADSLASARAEAASARAECRVRTAECDLLRDTVAAENAKYAELSQRHADAEERCATARGLAESVRAEARARIDALEAERNGLARRVEAYEALERELDDTLEAVGAEQQQQQQQQEGNHHQSDHQQGVHPGDHHQGDHHHDHHPNSTSATTNAAAPGARGSLGQSGRRLADASGSALIAALAALTGSIPASNQRRIEHVVRLSQRVRTLAERSASLERSLAEYEEVTVPGLRSQIAALERRLETADSPASHIGEILAEREREIEDLVQRASAADAGRREMRRRARDAAARAKVWERRARTAAANSAYNNNHSNNNNNNNANHYSKRGGGGINSGHRTEMLKVASPLAGDENDLPRALDDTPRASRGAKRPARPRSMSSPSPVRITGAGAARGSVNRGRSRSRSRGGSVSTPGRGAGKLARILGHR